LTDKEPQKIPVGDIDVDDGIEDLATSIKKFGLLQPITVYQKSDTKKYVLLAGQRRYSAFVELNKKYPGEGWDKIPAIVIDESDGGSTIDVPPAEV
jgi:ParB/RepB/Spo0J family partition protein